MTGRPEFPCSFQAMGIPGDDPPCGLPSSFFYEVTLNHGRPPYGRCEEHRRGRSKPRPSPSSALPVYREISYEEAVVMSVMLR